MLKKEINVDKLNVKVFDTRKNMGEYAADEFRVYLADLLTKKKEVNIIFAAAPSQMDFLVALRSLKGIDWSRVNAFHMDEYVGIGIDQPQSFAQFVKREVADPLHVGKFFPINGKTKCVEKELKRYTKLLEKYPTDIVCLGIGENAHIAFNDPGEADFFDPRVIKKVTLDDVCRQQQVNDGCFPTFDSVPKYAYSLTVPTLLRGEALFCLVPAKTKADAVKKVVNEDINDLVPATIMRIHNHATMYCDSDSGNSLLK